MSSDDAPQMLEEFLEWAGPELETVIEELRAKAQAVKRSNGQD